MKLRNREAKVFYLFMLLNIFKVTYFELINVEKNSFIKIGYKFIVTFLLLLLIYSLILKVKKRKYFLIFYILQIVFFYFTVTYYLYFKMPLNMSVLENSFTEGISLVRNFSIPLYKESWFNLIDLLFFIISFINFNEIANYFKEKTLKKTKSISLILLLTIYLINSIQGKGFMDIIKTSEVTRYFGEEQSIMLYGYIPNMAIGIFVNKDEKKIIANLKTGKKIESINENIQNPNFVLLQIESLDFTVINKKIGNVEVTPYLNKLSRENIYYKYCLSNHYAGTLDAEFTAINGIEPIKEFPVFQLRDYDYPNSVVKILNDKYSTSVFHGNTLSFFNRNIAYAKMKFENKYGLKEMKLKEHGWGNLDDDVFNFMEKKITNEKEPFFSYYISLSSHYPYENVRNYTKFNKFIEVNDKIISDYYNSINYVDYTLKDFVENIRKSKPNTYFIIYGDHMSEVEKAKKDIGIEFVPMIIVTPDGKKNANNEIVVSFYDVAPTILFNSGLKFETNSFGADLINKNLEDSKIPYKGRMYSRKVLLEIIKKRS